MIELKSFAGHTHQGPCLQINEDAHDVDLNNNLFMILDGFGGSGIGDQVVKKVIETIKYFYSKVIVDPDSTMPFFYGQKYTLEGNFLLNAFHYAHKMVCQYNLKKEMNARGGASAIVGVLADNLLTFATTGNCRLYLMRQGHLNRVFSEDSLSWAAGDITDLKFKTFPLSGLGLFNELYLETKEIKVNDGDLFCLFTDGIYAGVQEEELKHTLENTSANLKEKIESLTNLSNERGNLDNQSALLLQF